MIHFVLSLTFLASLSEAATVLSGTYKHDLVLDAASSPYHIFEDITVSQSLTIEPDVVVHFKDPATIFVQQDITTPQTCQSATTEAPRSQHKSHDPLHHLLTTPSPSQLVDKALLPRTIQFRGPGQILLHSTRSATFCGVLFDSMRAQPVQYVSHSAADAAGAAVVSLRGVTFRNVSDPVRQPRLEVSDGLFEACVFGSHSGAASAADSDVMASFLGLNVFDTCVFDHTYFVSSVSGAVFFECAFEWVRARFVDSVFLGMKGASGGNGSVSDVTSGASGDNGASGSSALDVNVNGKDWPWGGFSFVSATFDGCVWQRAVVQYCSECEIKNSVLHGLGLSYACVTGYGNILDSVVSGCNVGVHMRRDGFNVTRTHVLDCDIGVQVDAADVEREHAVVRNNFVNNSVNVLSLSKKDQSLFQRNYWDATTSKDVDLKIHDVMDGAGQGYVTFEPYEKSWIIGIGPDNGINAVKNVSERYWTHFCSVRNCPGDGRNTAPPTLQPTDQPTDVPIDRRDYYGSHGSYGSYGSHGSSGSSGSSGSGSSGSIGSHGSHDTQQNNGNYDNYGNYGSNGAYGHYGNYGNYGNYQDSGHYGPRSITTTEAAKKEKIVIDTHKGSKKSSSSSSNSSSGISVFGGIMMLLGFAGGIVVCCVCLSQYKEFKLAQIRMKMVRSIINAKNHVQQSKKRLRIKYSNLRHRTLGLDDMSEDESEESEDKVTRHWGRPGQIKRATEIADLDGLDAMGTTASGEGSSSHAVHSSDDEELGLKDDERMLLCDSSDESDQARPLRKHTLLDMVRSGRRMSKRFGKGRKAPKKALDSRKSVQTERSSDGGAATDMSYTKCVGIVRRALIYGKREVYRGCYDAKTSNLNKKRLDALLEVMNKELVSKEERKKIVEIATAVQDSPNGQIGIDLLDTLDTMNDDYQDF